MIKEKEEMLEKLNNVKELAQNYFKENNFENYAVKNVIHYNKKVELVNKETGEKEEFDLYAVIAENTDIEKGGEPIFELEYLEDKNGNIVTISDLIREYEGFESIKDVVDKTQENEEKPEKEQNKELKKDSLEELEKEKGQEKEEKKKDKEDSKSDLTGKKPTHVLQTIDADSTYVDNWTTVSKAFDLPPEVKYIAIAHPMQKDDHILSSTMTMYMLDNSENVIENVRGKTIRDYFEIDNATGHNPMHDDNTKLELEEDYAEKNIGQTMRRFKSKEDPDLYLSIEQKEVGGYHEVYAGGRTLDGNDPVEVQLETRNVEIQTDLEMQKIISGRKGYRNKDKIDSEADAHKEHGDDEEKLPVAHADGDERTIVFKCKYIPGTDKTWEELSKETGENIQELQERFVRELRDGNKPKDIVEEIEYDYEMVGPNRDRR